MAAKKTAPKAEPQGPQRKGGKPAKQKTKGKASAAESSTAETATAPGTNRPPWQARQW
jgi:hypothetical protein